MDLDFTDEQIALRDRARELAADLRGAAPASGADIRKRLSASGLLGLLVPESHGGAGGDPVALALVIDQLARASASAAVILGGHSVLCDAVTHEAAPETQAAVLPRAARGEALGCVALNAPAVGPALSADPTADGFRLRGAVRHVTAAGEADLLLAFAAIAGADPCAAFLVDLHRPGIRRAPIEAALGLAHAPATTLLLDGVVVDAAARLGEEGSGAALLEAALGLARIGVAAAAMGLGRRALQRSLAWVDERGAAAQPDQLALSDGATELAAAAMLTLKAAALRSAGRPHAVEASSAKLYAPGAAARAAERALALHGEDGYDDELGRLHADARRLETYLSPSEREEILIATALLQE